MTKHSLLVLGCVITLLALTACGGGGEQAAPPSAEETAPAAAPAGGTASVAGTVTYANGDPDTKINMNADPVCQGLHSDAVHTEKVVAADGNLANVFVYVKEGVSGSYSPPAEAALLDQKGCLYLPHVTGVQVGQKMIIRNSDETLHNVHAMPSQNKEFNMGQPFQGMELEKTFDTAEVMIPVKCDVHPWMKSYIGVLDHPYFAVSGADGGFSIGNLPAGDYVLEAWHEELGTKTQSVTVGDGESVEVSFDFSPAAG